jgi:hypothetical protein
MASVFRSAIFIALCLLTPSFMDGQTCTQTFTPSNIGTNPFAGDSVNTAVRNGNGKTVLCFSAGSYGEIDLYADHPSGVVTLMPAPGAAVNMGLFNLNGVSNVTITGFSGSSASNGLLLQVAGQGNNSNITFSNNSMSSNGVSISGNTNANANILITHNSFVGFASSDEVSRLHIFNNSACPDGITISNNLMSGGQSDGIQYGSSCGTQIIGNEFSNIHENNCNGIHCDAIQDGGGGQNTVISGNYIHDTSDCFLLDDGSTNTTISDNVCNTDGQDNYWMQFGGGQTITLNHNTIVSTAGAQYGNDHNGNPSSNVTLTNNIFYSQLSQNAGQPVSGDFVNDYNLCKSGCSGAHSLNGTPTFVGGSSPSAYASFALATSSIGRGAGNDGKDMGVRFSNSQTQAPQPPTNLTSTVQ